VVKRRSYYSSHPGSNLTCNMFSTRASIRDDKVPMISLFLKCLRVGQDVPNISINWVYLEWLRGEVVILPTCIQSLVVTRYEQSHSYFKFLRVRQYVFIN
jgi:hypothetical protein